jgi:glycosyltransferase involved in cell wall biosynthesis
LWETSEPSKEKWELLQGAISFLFPSFYEGFGIPVLEALSVGVPVITTKNSSLAEIGSEEVKYVSTEDPQEMMKAMEHFHFLPEDSSLQEQRKNYSSQFSWERAAKMTLDIFSESLKHGLQIQDKNKLDQ